MRPDQPNFFSGPYVDRRAEQREDAGWARTALEDPETLYLLGSGTRHLVYARPEPRIAFLAAREAAAAADPTRLVLLGWFRGRRCVLVELGDEPPCELPQNASFEESSKEA